jgi:hypothetical protein
MRIGVLVLGVFAALAAFLIPRAEPAHAAFHCMRIHAVLGGYAGDSTIQFVELRMNASGQTAINGHKIEFYDASNVKKATFTFPSNLPIGANGALGDSILIATQEFEDATPNSPDDADFLFAGNTVWNDGLDPSPDPAHPIQSPGGKVHFAPGNNNCDANLMILSGEVDSLAYGSAASNWTSPAVALPMPGTTEALQLQNLNIQATNNSTEYLLATVSNTNFTVTDVNMLDDNKAMPRNNERQVLAIPIDSNAVGGVAERPDNASLPAAVSAGSGGDRWQDVSLALAAIAAVAALGVAGWRAQRRTR